MIFQVLLHLNPSLISLLCTLYIGERDACFYFISKIQILWEVSILRCWLKWSSLNSVLRKTLMFFFSWWRLRFCSYWLKGAEFFDLKSAFFFLFFFTKLSVPLPQYSMYRMWNTLKPLPLSERLRWMFCSFPSFSTENAEVGVHTGSLAR